MPCGSESELNSVTEDGSNISPPPTRGGRSVTSGAQERFGWGDAPQDQPPTRNASASLQHSDLPTLGEVEISVNGEELHLHPSGVLWWAAERALVFADLHF